MQELLAELNQELQSAGDFDPKTRELLQQLNDELDVITASSPSSALDRAKELETRFAAVHPVAERIARELADIIAKMGI